MSQQIATIDLNSASKLPAYLQAFQTTIGKNLIVGGQQRNRIGLKGNRFRLVLNGQEEGVVDENYLDAVIVGAAEGVSRIFYADAYDAGVKVAPTCYSKQGLAPENDVKNKQASKCAMCPQNEKGSRITEGGGKTRACQFFKRLAVVLPSEPTRVYQLDVKAMGIFGESKPQANKFSLGEYGKKLGTRGIDPSMLVTRLSFDTDSSVPKLLFSPTRYLDQDEAPAIADVIAGDEVKQILEITAQTVDLSGETSAEEVAPAAEPEAAAPVVAAKPVGPTLSKAAASAPAAAAAPAKTAGPTLTVRPAPGRAAAVPPAAKPAAPVAPAAAASEGDDDLAALLASLDAE